MGHCIVIRRTVKITEHITIDVPDGADPETYELEVLDNATKGRYDDEGWEEAQPIERTTTGEYTTTVLDY